MYVNITLLLSYCWFYVQRFARIERRLRCIISDRIEVHASEVTRGKRLAQFDGFVVMHFTLRFRDHENIAYNKQLT